MITICKATTSQLDDLAPLFDAYRVFYKKKTNIKGAKEFLKQRLAKKQSVIFIAYEDSKAVGFTQLYPSYSSVSMAPLWILNDLFVSPKHRSKKIGIQLLESAQVFSVETNTKGISLETEKSNTIGNQLYPKMNFKKDEEHNFYFWSNTNFSS